MAETGDVFILHGPDDAVGHFLFVGGEAGMDRGDDIIEFFEDGVGKIELSLFQDVAFRPSEEGAFGFLGVVGMDFLDLGFQAFRVQAVSLKRRLGMVGDTEPFKAKVGGRLGHGGEGVLPIAGDGVVMKTTANFIPSDEIGEMVLFRRRDLSAVLPNFGGNERESKGRVQILFFLQLHRSFGLALEKAPFTQMQTAIHSSLAEGDVMFFGPGEVGQSGGPSLGWNNAQVAGDTPLKNDAGFGFAVSDHFFDIRAGNKGLHDLLGFFGGGDQIKVLDDFLSAPKAAGNFGLKDDRRFAEVSQEGLGGGEGIA